MAKELEKKRIIELISKVIGNKTYQFDVENRPKLGDGYRTCYRITKNYAYMETFWLSYDFKEETNEYGAYINKIPIYYRKGDGKIANRISLSALFYSDLTRIYDSLKQDLEENETIYLETLEKLEKIMVKKNLREKLIKIA